MTSIQNGFPAVAKRLLGRAAASVPLRTLLLTGLLTGLLVHVSGIFANTSDYAIAQTPLYLTQSKTPLMMLVQSRDEQLFNKAYSDYTDLDGDGQIDTTYKNAFEYAGYFDPDLCYSGGTGGTPFKASGAATNHQCGGKWSGNFLNWVTMSRLDILRYVLYGGKRSTDTTKQTVLERAHIPSDLHAWVKVYADNGSFTPYSGTYSFCNVSTSLTGDPLMRAAAGNWSEWAATSTTQCATNNGSDTPSKVAQDYAVRVDVCDNASAREGFCSKYSDGTHDYWKPTGLLQEYGEAGKLRFGMVSGSYSEPRAGGVLRRNIGLFAGNVIGSTCASNATTGGIDEVNTKTGQFCENISGSSSAEGIIRTLDSFKLTNWSGSVWNDCDTYGILNQDMRNQTSGNRSCTGWGNPLAEMYAEALRYISGETSATTGFAASGDLSGLPTNVAWKDPYRDESKGGNSYCASCNILVLSSGLPSFDSDNVPSVPGMDPAVSATNAVGTAEGLSGKYFAGNVSTTTPVNWNTTYEYLCTSQTVTGSLGNVLGLCPDSPSTEGSYLISGLAYDAHTKDLRATHVPVDKPSASTHKTTATTYAVQMAESLPTFTIPAGNGAITLSPLCQANNNGSATNASGSWRTCFLGSVGVGATTASLSPQYVYGRDLQYSGGKLVAGSYKLVWEDSLWGNDHDNDVVAMLSFCVGSACHVANSGTYGANASQNICWRSSSTACGSTAVASDEVMVRLETLSAYAGNAMLSGFTVTGSNADGTYRDLLRPGNQDNSILTSTANPPSTWDKPVVYRFKPGSGATGVLQNPLWYAAKYGGFENSKGTVTTITNTNQWDTDGDGTPDGYFLAHNPARLKADLEKIFDSASGGQSSVSGSSSGSRVSDTSSTFSVAASFNSNVDVDATTGKNVDDWVGDVSTNKVNADGTIGDTIWQASSKISATGRNIVAVEAPTKLKADGTVDTAVSAAQFADTILGGNETDKLAALGLDSGSLPTWWTSGTAATAADLVAYLRGATNAKFRTRTSILGDIVNSSPIVSTKKDDYGYSTWASSTDTGMKNAGTAYATYLTNKTGNGAVYVGANDGMLHAFDVADGSELFAFIPSSSRQHMAQLANPSYSHQYYVDGLLTVGDASYADASWHTVLIGSTGGGGAVVPNDSKTLPQGSVFALDVTNPSLFSSTGSKVLWELSGRNDDDLGHVLGQPVLVPVQTATGTIKFVALFGNGVDSVSGRPVLYVVDVETGALIKKLYPTDGSYADKNGLVNIAAVSLKRSDRVADTVYGGDMQGHVWKFDLSGDVSDWDVAYGGAPLFTAAYTVTSGGTTTIIAQPITGGIQVTAGVGGSGAMLFFGTGSYFAETDPANTQTQSLYAIWDNGTAIADGRDDLVGQGIAGVAAADGYTTGSTTANPVNYAATRGWYLDLTDSGERFIGTPTLQSGVVYYASYTPARDKDCSGDGKNVLYGLNVLTGTGALGGITDVAGNTVCTANCGKVSLTGNTAPNEVTPPVKSAEVFLTQNHQSAGTGAGKTDITGRCVTTITPVGGKDTFVVYRPCGRQSWRQLR